MYIIDFFKKIFKKHNVMIVIYMLLTLAVSALLPALLAQGAYFGFAFFLHILKHVPMDTNTSILENMLMGTSLLSIMALIVSIFIFISPVGEFMLRKHYKCRKIESVEKISHIEQIYHAAMEKAEALNSHIYKHIKVYVTDGLDPSVVSLGRSSIVVTEGFFSLDDNKAEALIARELGHISEKDPDFNLLILATTTSSYCSILFFQVVYLFVAAFCMIGAFTVGFLIVVASSLLCLIPGGGFVAFAAIAKNIITMLFHILMALLRLVPASTRGLFQMWSKVGSALMRASRAYSEMESDEFAFNCGYGEELYQMITVDQLPDAETSIFRSILKSYPSSEHRIAQLEQLGFSTQTSRMA